MDGVTVLNEYAELITTSNTKLAIWIAVIVFVIMVGVVVIATIIERDITILIYGVLAPIFSLMAFGVTMGITEHEAETGRQIMQVTVSEDVNMNEFFNEYELIDTNGKIYSIIEREG